jgi:hypothetical protein
MSYIMKIESKRRKARRFLPRLRLKKLLKKTMKARKCWAGWKVESSQIHVAQEGWEGMGGQGLGVEQSWRK